MSYSIRIKRTIELLDENGQVIDTTSDEQTKAFGDSITDLITNMPGNAGLAPSNSGLKIPSMPSFGGDMIDDTDEVDVSIAEQPVAPVVEDAQEMPSFGEGLDLDDDDDFNEESADEEVEESNDYEEDINTEDEDDDFDEDDEDFSDGEEDEDNI